MVLDRALLEAAAEAVRGSDALLIGAGAGMGVDSGLPDFRGDQGFWRAYPPFARRGLSFIDLANPQWFERDPELAWGFYGHRLNLYRDTVPHPGFAILQRWAERMRQGLFVFTSNVDGQFQRAGVDQDRVAECHGSILHLQCSAPCSDQIWPAGDLAVEVDPASFQARAPLPRCPRCDALARPNILMFGDGGWLAQRSHAQEGRLNEWLAGLGGSRLLVVECGAGTAIPSVRWRCEQAVGSRDGVLVRINPREAQGPVGTISLAAGALEALQAVDTLLDTGP